MPCSSTSASGPHSQSGNYAPEPSRPPLAPAAIVRLTLLAPVFIPRCVASKWGIQPPQHFLRPHSKGLSPTNPLTPRTPHAKTKLGKGAPKPKCTPCPPRNRPPPAPPPRAPTDASPKAQKPPTENAAPPPIIASTASPPRPRNSPSSPTNPKLNSTASAPPGSPASNPPTPTNSPGLRHGRHPLAPRPRARLPNLRIHTRNRPPRPRSLPPSEPSSPSATSAAPPSPSATVTKSNTSADSAEPYPPFVSKARMRFAVRAQPGSAPPHLRAIAVFGDIEKDVLQIAFSFWSQDKLALHGLATFA